MSELGLFPLGIVLLPTERIPLHIFEPRYRELIGECLEHDREFGLVHADDDGLRSIGTRATVVSVVERFDDGRLNVVVEGGERFRIVELTSGRSFHTGRVEPVADRSDPALEDSVTRALELFERVLDVTGAESEPPESTHPQLSFAIAARFELPPQLKQDLLQRTSERERLGVVCEILERAGDAAERQRELSALAQRNGRVPSARD